MPWQFLSATPGTLWPALPVYSACASLALLQQLETSERASTDRFAKEQRRQLDVLLRHAWDSVPYYRQAWAGRYDPAVPMSRERFLALPLLGRSVLRERYETLKTRALPREHGQPVETRTSGSTGAPVRIMATDVTRLFWEAITLRDHLWHRRNLLGKLAVIRRGVTPGTAPSWGKATAGVVQTGEASMLDVDMDVGRQLDWLERQAPAYLLTYPSLAAQLARESLARGRRLDGLLEVRTLGESMSDEVREWCRVVWGAPVVDTYSAEEVGYIALQCPDHEHYHVMAESVLVEVLDERGAACTPGQTGRVVITDLHNFATPLVRYDIGDYAEVGESCACGRTLPVLRRILGRVRNVLIAADGRRYWPAFGSRALSEIAAIRQHQLVQKSHHLVEVRLVVEAPLTVAEEERLRRHVLSRLPEGFELQIIYRDHIPRGAGGKFEEFVSEIASA
jgi:phenylacetate-CoA ligase